MNASGGTSGAAATLDPSLREAVRADLGGDRGSSTAQAARRLGVPERAVVEALVGHWPVVRLRGGAAGALIEALPGLGPLRVSARSRGAVIEAVGTVVKVSENGPYLDLRTEALTLHVRRGDLASAYALEQTDGETGAATYSWQFFDRQGDAALKVSLWDSFPDVPAHRAAAFCDLTGRFAADPAEAPGPGTDTDTEPAGAEAGALPAVFTAGEEPAAAPGRVAIPIPAGVLPGSSKVGRGILGKGPALEVPRPHGRRSARRVRLVRYGLYGAVALGLMALALWAGAAFVAPLFWRHYEHHLCLAQAPKFALSAQSAADEPLNVGLFGTEPQVIQSLLEAGWSPGDPATFLAGLKSERALLQQRSYPRATLHDLYLFGRRQDLMFEKPIRAGRHVVRLWRSDELGLAGRPLWIGAAGLDRNPANKATAGPTLDADTHHVGPDLDASRDVLIDDLSRALRLTEVFQVTGVGPTFSGQTADGDRYYTDGELAIGTIITSRGTSDRPPEYLPSPWPVRVKDQLMSDLRPLFTDNSSG
jgi:putative heme iron utilization protein